MSKQSVINELKTRRQENLDRPEDSPFDLGLRFGYIEAIEALEADIATPIPSSPGDEPQSALLLTDHEWNILAGICGSWLAVAQTAWGEEVVREVWSEESDLANRIIQASGA